MANTELTMDATRDEDVRIEIPHVRQGRSWDCGLACITMVLRFFNVDYADFQQLCQKLNFGDSVWTIDLAHMLHHYHIRHMFCTITVGVDKGYSKKSFYRERFTADERRVNSMFENATKDGIVMEKRSVTIDEIVGHLVRERQPLIVLVDWAHLSCRWCTGQRILSAVSCGCVSSCVSNYQGHFIVVCGYNEKEKLIYYKNPSFGVELCCCNVRTFEAARKSYGTDEDILFIYDRQSQSGLSGQQQQNNQIDEVS